MTDDERDARIETLIDAIADTNRSLADSNRSLRDAIAETNRSLGDAIAETNRAVAALGVRVETLTDAIVDTNTNVATVAHELAGLGRLMRLHLVVDHGYEEPDDE